MCVILCIYAIVGNSHYTTISWYEITSIPGNVLFSPKKKRALEMTQTFSRLWDNYPTDKDALKARNKEAKRIREQGFHVDCFTLRNQLKPYKSCGVPDGRSCNVYCLQYQNDSMKR